MPTALMAAFTVVSADFKNFTKSATEYSMPEFITIIVDQGELSVAPEAATAKLIRALTQNGDQFRFIVEMRGRENSMLKSGRTGGKGI